MLRTITGTTAEQVAFSASQVFHELEQDLRPYTVTALPPSAEGAGDVGQIGERRVMLQTVGSEQRVRYFERLKGPSGDAQWREFPHREIGQPLVIYNQLIVEQDSAGSDYGILFRTSTNEDNEVQRCNLSVRSYDRDSENIALIYIQVLQASSDLWIGAGSSGMEKPATVSIAHSPTGAGGAARTAFQAYNYETDFPLTDVTAASIFEVAVTHGSASDFIVRGMGTETCVGIGVYGPGTNLHVLKSNTKDMTAEYGSLVSIEQSSTGDAAIEFQLTSGQLFSMGIDNSQTGDPFSIYDGTTERLNISSTGNVTLSADLCVDGGDIGLTTDTDLIQIAANSVTVNGTFSATTITGMAPSSATYIVQTANVTLTNEQVLSVLATGLVKNTTTTGVLSIGVADTDYQQPVTWGDGLAYAAPTASIDYNVTNLKITTAQLNTIQDIAAASSPTFAGLNLSDGNITNVGQLDLDLIRADAANGSITIELDAAAGADLIVGNNALVVEGDTGFVGINTSTPAVVFNVVMGNAEGIRLSSGAVDAFTYLSLARVSKDLSLGVAGGADQFFTGVAAGEIAIKGESSNKIHLGIGNLSPTITVVDGKVGINIVVPAAVTDADQSSTTGAIPVLRLDQADVSEEFIRFIGTSANGVLTQSIVEAADVGVATIAGYLKVFVQDDGNQLTDQAYYLPIYTLA